jgi:hypothetical protein
MVNLPTARGGRQCRPREDRARRLSRPPAQRPRTLDELDAAGLDAADVAALAQWGRRVVYFGQCPEVMTEGGAE